ncbi:type IV secretion system protein [Virgibacillus halodenitrificans]|uniref:type IV secretion system protein n=1 Tax=Virgibacillus halodenitrificans TaxID=1482 RepID=UPI000EF530A5|nr:type IV secretion system protein [Virgibacillus halodenitrificans]
MMMSSFNWTLGFGWLADKAWDIVSGIFKGVWESIIGPFDDLHGLKTLVFNQYDDGERVFGTFTESEITNAIAPGVQSMSYIVGFFLVLGIIFMGVKISNTGLNPANRTMFIEFIRDWVIIVLALTNIGFLYEMIFMFNEAIVGIINGEIINNLEDKLMPDIEDSGLVGWIIIGLFMLGLNVWANFYYMMREITLMVLMILGPVFLALYLFPTTKPATLAWLKELIGTVMIQSVHAVTLFVIAIINDSGESGLIAMTIMYLIVIPTGEAVKSLLNLGGDMTGRLGKFATMSGAAGMAGIYGAVKSATSGKSFAQSLRSGMRGANETKNGKSGEDGGSDSSGSTVGPMAGTDTRSERMLRAGEILSKGGKMVVGAAGSTAGAVMGPEGVFAGGSIGAGLGDKGGGLSGRLGFATGDKLKNALEKSKDGISEAKGNMMNEFDAEQTADQLADLQTNEWANDPENYNHFKKELEERGGPINDKELNKMWGQKIADQRKKFKTDNKAALLNGTFNDDNYARASDLAENMAQEKLQQSIAQNGRDEFVKGLPETGENGELLSQEEIEKRWSDEKAHRLGKFRNQSQDVARRLTGNKPMDSFVNKDDFKKAYQDDEMAHFDTNRDAFENHFRKENPNATDDEVKSAWNTQRNKALESTGATAQKISDNTHSVSPVSMNPNQAKASDLTEKAALNMTEDWKKQNESSFKEKVRQTGMQEIEREVETDWQQKISQTRSNNQQQARLDTQNWAKDNEQGVKAQLMQDNPNLSPEQLDTKFNTIVQDKLNENMKNADAKTAKWVQKNEQPVKTQMMQTKQQGLEDRVNSQWEKAVDDQFVNNNKFAGQIAQKISGGQSLSAFVDKDQFSNELANQRINHAKTNFKQQNPHLQGNALEQAWDDQGAEMAIRKSSAIEMQPRKLSSGYNTKAALATDFATKATDAWANNPENKQSVMQKAAQEIDSLPENIALKQSNPDAYQQKLQTHQNEKWDNAVQGQFNKNMKKAEDTMLMNNSDNGVVMPTNIGGVVKGAKAFASGYKSGSGINFTPAQYAKGFKNGSGGIAKRHNAGVREVIDQEYGDAPVEEKAKAYRDKVSYRQGVLRGISGYHKSASKAMEKNPYAQQMYDSAHELTDIAQMAKTETIDLPNGQQQKRIAQGAVQLVVERDRSYIQVETKDGQRKTVSQYGAGDSSLKEGTVLFKDYNIENGQLMPMKSGGGKESTGFYAKDTGGHKISVNRPVNIDANSLLQSKRNIPNQQLEPKHDAYNVTVDQGNFSVDNIKDHSADNKAVLVVEKDRSYLAMKNSEDNKMYRVSPVKNSKNSNLQQGQVIYKEYAVEGGKLRERSLDKNVKLETYTVEVEGNTPKKVIIDSSQIPDDIEVNKLVGRSINKRVDRRKELERRRTKSGAYL